MFGYSGPRFICYWWHTSWTHLSFGVHLCLEGPNFEVHLPFGFLRFGLRNKWSGRERGWFTSKAAAMADHYSRLCEQ